MELIGKKTVKLQDAKFKIHKNGSNETSIFIDQEIASKINLIDGADITFIINEDNILRALSFVFQFKKTLFKKDKIYLDQDWFNKEYEVVRKHFLNGNEYKCKVNNSNGRFYLNSLPQTSGLNIRNILIENHFELEFLNEEDNILLKLNYSDNEIDNLKVDQVVENKIDPLIINKKLTEFSLSTLVLLIKEFGDEFIKNKIEKFDTKVGEFKHTGYKIPTYFGSVRVFGAFESRDVFQELLDSKERTRYHSLNLNILNAPNIYFSTEIEFNNTKKSSNLYFGDFKNFIEDYSIGKYSIKKIEESYLLYELIPSDFHCKQKIYFGSPGTGKSRLIKQKVGNGWPRITFHPELDYHGFVGSYKPTMKPSIGGRSTEEISYEYVPEAFIKAYCKAWKTDTTYYLIIEEINRGNCAQIFGDIFQLLDRGEDGYSEYPIECSPDIQRFLEKEFESDFERRLEYAKKTGVTDFSKMVLPNNLSVLATMNTSDQSLFPMDSAFKRRWDWQYVPINYADAETFDIDLGNNKIYNWGRFIRAINELIKEHTKSEDKQLGNRFVSSPTGKITGEQFVSKVVFYLWSEIYKEEQGTGDTIFFSADKTEITFSDFFLDGKVNLDTTQKFIQFNLRSGEEENKSDGTVSLQSEINMNTVKD